MLQRIREDPERVRAMLAARHFDAPLDRLIELDLSVRKLQGEKEQLQAERNKASKGGPPTEAVKKQMREIGERIKEIEAALAPLMTERDEVALHIPNEIDPAAPVGPGDESNRVVRQDQTRGLAFAAKPHWELGEQLGILDIPRGTKISGSRFYVSTSSSTRVSASPRSIRRS